MFEAVETNLATIWQFSAILNYERPKMTNLDYNDILKYIFKKVLFKFLDSNWFKLKTTRI